ncbi:hypothetical protein BLX87_23065 [Bacillus sp. VT-16-64]|uniref:BC1872 family protein n=1 Tax=Siminovitchia sp. FSL W7-1587 TaxID=2954699 RepID=UPI00097D7807|nr:hypothetical protein BLX87_23065 [Bacillus sp. VT-16-64]
MDLIEIDRLIAEKVMGWEFYEDGESWTTENGDHLFFSACDANEWAPSSDISDAWLVVEKLKNKKTYLNICPEKERCTVDTWYEDDNGYYLPYTSVEAKTAPLAICLAALKSVGVEVESNERKG